MARRGAVRGSALCAATAAYTVNRLLTSRRNKLAALRASSTAPFARGLAHALASDRSSTGRHLRCDRRKRRSGCSSISIPIFPDHRPLKAKLYQIDPAVKVFRCKVQTPPGKQFEVRNEADRLIEAALKENEIEFADNKPRVTLYQASLRQPVTSDAPATETPISAE